MRSNSLGFWHRASKDNNPIEPRAKTISDKEILKLNGLDALVINALRYESHPSHLNIEEALEIVNQVKPKQTFFTHISHNMGFHEEVCSNLPKSVSLAFDGLVLEVD